MSAALRLSPRDRAAASVEAAASVAVSSPEPTVTDTKRLLALGCTCRRAAGAFAIEAARLAVKVERGEYPETGAAAQMAQSTLDLEHAAQHLQAEAQDAELLALLQHRARFADLLRIAEAMERGAVFVPMYPVDVVVAAEEDASARPVTIVQFLGRVARRLTVFRMAA